MTDRGGRGSGRAFRDPRHVRCPAGACQAVMVCAAADSASSRLLAHGAHRPFHIRDKTRSAAVALLLALLFTAGCDAGADRIPLPENADQSGSAAAVSTPSLTPVTPDGFVTGPGVTDDSITLGVLVDPVDDRGFVAGVQLWQEAVNTSGGLCGRRIQLATAGQAGVPANAFQAYQAIGRSVLGLVVLRAAAAPDELSDRISADRLPTLTPTGISTALGSTLPIVVGATADVLAINGLDYLKSDDRVRSGGTVGVLTDGSPAAENALSGARWWAADRGIALDVRSAVEPTVDLASWGPATAVLSLADAATTADVVAATSADTTVLTTIDGYDPDIWSAPALAAAASGRVLISTSTPAYGSDYPAAVSVAARASAAGLTARGPRLFEGYATGVSWDRLLTQACTDRSLTRPSIEQALVTVGPASVDSLFGPTDPARPVQSRLPATLLSAVSRATPSTPGGLTPVTWPQAASGIEDYRP